MKKVSHAIEVDMIDYGPKFEDSGPDKIVAASGILTMRKKDFTKMLGDIDNKVLKGFHNEATKRGHASLTTSVNFYFWLEGSRILDFYFSSFPFGSYIISSSRRIVFGPEHLVIPDSIAESEFKDDYEKLCREMIELYHIVKEETSIDNARRILPIGFVSSGLFAFPLQLILGIIKEVREDDQRKTPTLPKEIGEIAALLEESINEKTNYLANAALKLPYNTNFPHPNLFRNDVEFEKPGVRILLKDENFEELLNILKVKLDKLEVEKKDLKHKINEASEIWKGFIEKAQNKILLEANLLGSLTIWNDIKRHRTVRQKVEPIYTAIERSIKNWDENNFYIPKVKDPKLKEEIIEVYKKAFWLYNKMVENGIEKRDAIYIIPHGINLRMNMFFDGYHLFDPFGFLSIRTCTTTDHEIVEIFNKVINILRNNIPETEGLIGPKCKLGYCPERNFCGLIKKFVKDYDEDTHSIF